MKSDDKNPHRGLISKKTNENKQKNELIIILHPLKVFLPSEQRNTSKLLFANFYWFFLLRQYSKGNMIAYLRNYSETVKTSMFSC